MTTPAAFTRRFGVTAPDVSAARGWPRIRFAVADASLLQAAPELAGIAGIYAGNPTIIGADDALGAVIIFEPEPLTGSRAASWSRQMDSKSLAQCRRHRRRRALRQ